MPSAAVIPALAANATSVSADITSIFADRGPSSVRRPSRHLLAERIVPNASRITNRRRLTRIEHPNDAVERDRLVHVDIAGKFCIDGNQVVGAVELDAVAGIIDDCDVGIFCIPVNSRIARRIAGVAEIEFAFDDLESGLLEHRPHRRRIPSGIGERLDVFVRGVANDQRDAALGGREPGRQHQR